MIGAGGMVTAMAIFLLAHIEVSHGAVSAQARLKPAVDAPDRREPPTEVGGKRRSAEADPYLSFQWWAVPTLHGFGWWAVPTVHGFRWWAVPTVHGFGWWSVPTLHGFGWWAVPTLPYVCSGGSARSQSADPAQTLRTTTRTTPRTTTRPTTRPVDPGPRVAQEDLALLVTYARRAFRAAVMALPERSARFYPPELAGMKGIIHLTLRSHGVVLAEAESAEM
ncbi:MAG: hypothetical protein ACE5EC_06860, partial [Phycisphaerae bacterium]